MIVISQILLIMALEDIYHMQVNDLLQVLLLASVLLTTEVAPASIVIAAVVFMLYIVYEQKKDVKIGGADIKILCSLFILGGLSMIVGILFVASILGITYSLLSKKKRIPFVPFIWIGYILVII